jgi:DsbC/DsbD-like thiol-disulfide interchange protein
MRRAIAALALSLPCVALAQDDETPVLVSFTVAPAQAAPGETVEVRATAKIAAGWHIYGAGETQGVPSKLEVTAPSQASLAGSPLAPSPHLEEVPYMGKMELLRGEVVFTQRLTLAADAAGAVSIPAAFTYQPCSEGEGGV